MTEKWPHYICVSCVYFLQLIFFSSIFSVRLWDCLKKWILHEYQIVPPLFFSSPWEITILLSELTKLLFARPRKHPTDIWAGSEHLGNRQHRFATCRYSSPPLLAPAAHLLVLVVHCICSWPRWHLQSSPRDLSSLPNQCYFFCGRKEETATKQSQRKARIVLIWLSAIAYDAPSSAPCTATNERAPLPCPHQPPTRACSRLLF